MLERPEIERLAAAAAALRPEWPIKSLCTFLARDHAHRAYADVAIALTAIAVDPKTKTPKRMNELGPWWAAASAAFGDRANDTRYERCTVDGHRSYPAANCGACRSETLAAFQVRPTLEPVDVGPGPELARTALRTALDHQEDT